MKPTTGKPLRAAIYCRISRDATEEGLGVQRQADDCRARVEREGWDLVEVFTDNDTGASNLSRKPRPAYAEMIRRAEAGEIDVIVAYSNSRLTRRPAEWITLINLANAGQVRIATIVSGEHDLSTADGRAVAITISAWDAAEAERTGERVRRKKEQNAANGKQQGGRYRAFGYTRAWEIVPEEAAVVREMFKLRAGGGSFTSIGHEFASRGLLTSAGKPWNASNVAKLLSRPSYMAKRSHNGVVVGASAHDPIVTEDLWNAANSQEVDRPGTNARRWLLSKFARCGECHHSMVGNGAKGAYRCHIASGGCSKVSVKVEWLDGPIVSLVLAREKASAVASTTTAEAPNLGAIDAEIGAVRALYSSGDLALADMTAILKDLRAKRAEAERHGIELTMLRSGPALTWERWIDADISTRRQMIARHLDSVIVSSRKEKGPGRFDPTRYTIRWIDGTSQEVTHEDLAQVAQWKPATQTFGPSPGEPSLVAEGNPGEDEIQNWLATMQKVHG